jgi:hypothetical protein
MLRQPAIIISDRTLASNPAVSAGDWHDVIGHHRYYGSSACNGGERIVATRRGPRASTFNLFGF